MIIQFQNMRGQATSGGLDDRPPAYGARNTRADLRSLPFPSQSIIPDATLPFSQFPQPSLNKGYVLIDALVGALTGIGLVVAGLILLFVQT